MPHDQDHAQTDPRPARGRHRNLSKSVTEAIGGLAGRWLVLAFAVGAMAFAVGISHRTAAAKEMEAPQACG